MDDLLGEFVADLLKRVKAQKREDDEPRLIASAQRPRRRSLNGRRRQAIQIKQHCAILKEICGVLK
ncbi:hypothetical protein [Bradyrhizobium icense]|uniref:Uncharacterized protein n=1 Tax=Bradyrhizobium icense TaxID=1274631 RepID=A0A1B1UJI4_9BRAD|nr:hypothetical protein [Bradyrhizobium icense]ANW02915.1 hypothetical protein LMTR13_24900 [Bradyrhizobium icense]